MFLLGDFLIKGTSLRATAPIPSEFRICSISLPKFFLFGLKPIFLASLLITSPETKIGIFIPLATWEARLLPAPGIPTITKTLFSFRVCGIGPVGATGLGQGYSLCRQFVLSLVIRLRP